jgi:hypothetical protein
MAKARAIPARAFATCLVMTTSPLMMTVFIRHCETKKGRFIDEMKEPRLLPAGFFNGAG